LSAWGGQTSGFYRGSAKKLEENKLGSQD